MFMNIGGFMADFTMGEAAKRLGLSKPTVSSYIKKGKLAAEQLDDGSYRIDGGELARFEASYRKPARGKRKGEKPTDTRERSVDLQIAEIELRAARERIVELTSDRDQLRRELAKAQERADKLQDDMTQIAKTAVAQGQTPWWRKLIGKD